MTKADRGLRDAVTGKGRQKNPRIKTQQIHDPGTTSRKSQHGRFHASQNRTRKPRRHQNEHTRTHRSGLDVSYQEFFTFPEDGDETTELASSIALIKDPEVIRALHKIVNTLIHRDNK